MKASFGFCTLKMSWRYDPRVVIVGSGPSLCQEDIDLLLDCDEDTKVIVVNRTWRRIPTADMVYSNDHDWYESELRALENNGPELMVSGHDSFWDHPSITYVPFDSHAVGLKARPGHISWGMNSGAAALSLAHLMTYCEGDGTETPEIALLGFDQQWQTQPDGTELARWHGGHLPHLQNRKPGFHRWATWFEQAARDFKERGQRVVNCSRETSLTCFPRLPLKDFLQCSN